MLGRCGGIVRGSDVGQEIVSEAALGGVVRPGGRLGRIGRMFSVPDRRCATQPRRCAARDSNSAPAFSGGGREDERGLIDPLQFHHPDLTTPPIALSSAFVAPFSVHFFRYISFSSDDRNEQLSVAVICQHSIE